MIQYSTQTSAEKIAVSKNSTSATNKVRECYREDYEEGYKFNETLITYNELPKEEKISKEDEIKFYKKVFETKNI